ncbi:hypothetical protein ABRZ24_22240 [Brenneria populi]|uniref:Uncharacterized protein n=1 Tax=Brenneria populi TaxID=1505588 RepID=A0ABU6JXV6_9GAMM|nr:hypothetical protein [Brenneria populi Li et al. 2015]
MSNLVIETTYNKSFKSNVDDIIGSGLVFIFDNNLPQHYHGPYKYPEGGEIFNGDIVMTRGYFPWYSSNINKSRKILRTYGGQLYSTYKTINTKKISLAFESNPNIVVRSEWPVNNKDRECTKCIYPDCDIVFSIDERPDYEKLIYIKEKNNK